MPEYIRKRLGERLVEEKHITQEQFDLALKKHQETKVPLRQILIDMEFITEDRMVEFVAGVLGIQVCSDLIGKVADPEVTKIIPEKTCRQYHVFPLYKTANVLTVAMADPMDVFAIDDLENISRCKIEAVLSKKDE
ncbi:MAG: type II secretion system protein GspE, partial [Candidatus Omnitrophota bacterium]|nr:type II secretion system protein GspE [Candidatus Omnitrophota bacterium]